MGRILTILQKNAGGRQEAPPPAAVIKYPEKQLRRKGVYFRSQFRAVVRHCEGIGCMALKQLVTSTVQSRRNGECRQACSSCWLSPLYTAHAPTHEWRHLCPGWIFPPQLTLQEDLSQACPWTPWSRLSLPRWSSPVFSIVWLTELTIPSPLPTLLIHFSSVLPLAPELSAWCYLPSAEKCFVTPRQCCFSSPDSYEKTSNVLL